MVGMTSDTHEFNARRPVIGLEADVTVDGSQIERCSLRWNYCQAVIDAGGLPLILPPDPALAQAYLDQCDGVILTGGDDPRMEAFGQPTHACATTIEPRRQAFIVALLDALCGRRDLPVLGICLGMQMMALHAGGGLHQHLPDILPDATIHQKCNTHRIDLIHPDAKLFAQVNPEQPSDVTVVSAHRQAVSTSGQLRVIAKAPDGVIEAIDDPDRRFYAGVQWHPERGDAGPLSLGLWRLFVAACRNAN